MEGENEAQATNEREDSERRNTCIEVLHRIKRTQSEIHDKTSFRFHLIYSLQSRLLLTQHSSLVQVLQA